jgi:hypothetical protein
LGLQKAKSDSLSKYYTYFKIYVTKLLRNHYHAVACLFTLIYGGLGMPSEISVNNWIFGMKKFLNEKILNKIFLKY